MPEELLKPLFEQYTGQQLAELLELPSSGSNRRYFRLKGGKLFQVVAQHADEGEVAALDAEIAPVASRRG